MRNAVVLLALVCLSAEAQQVYKFGPGVHALDSLVINEPNSLVKGEGSGVTVLDIPGGIYVDAREPRLEGFTLRGQREGTGITLRNTYRARVTDVEIQSFELGLLSLCVAPCRQWLHTYTDLFVYEAPDGHNRKYDTRFKGVALVYEGPKLPRNWRPGSGYIWAPGEGFSNTHTFRGGRIVTSGTPLLIDGPTLTTVWSTYFDFLVEPIFITERAHSLFLHGVTLDPRNNETPIIQMENPWFADLRIIGGDAVRKHLIVDNEGNPVDHKYIWQVQHTEYWNP